MGFFSIQELQDPEKLVKKKGKTYLENNEEKVWEEEGERESRLGARIGNVWAFDPWLACDPGRSFLWHLNYGW